VTEANQADRIPERPPEAAPDDSPSEDLAGGLERALKPRRENVVPVDQPVALICQAQRSGGTLLARLFDGHPQCHSHPYEFQIGHPKPHTWPQLPLDEEPEAWFAKLREDYLNTLYIKGRRRIPLKGTDKTKASYPFLLLPAFQRLVFLEEVARRRPIQSERQILDSYLTSLFNAWLDNQNLVGGEKRWVAAFSPRRAWADGLDKLFELYPDGRMISILRDPESWFSSSQGRDPEADPEALIEQWKRSAREMIDAKDRFPKTVLIVRFDELVRKTEATMRTVAGFLKINYDPVLATPTFNRYPVGANSSYEVTSTGILADPVERYKEILSDEQRKRILAECKDLHKQALGLVERAQTTARRQSSSKKAPTRSSKTSKASPAKKRSASTKR
jgi:Sulfotransferase family